ncbi:transposase [Litoricolaceae bacterium]|nr:transposase [Litorivicinaceae bacterium]
MKKRRSFSREFKREAAGMALEQGFSSLCGVSNADGPVA